MRKWNRTAGSLFIAATSVYSVHTVHAAGDKDSASKPGVETVRVLENRPDPFATTQPTSEKSEPAPRLLTQGQSVKASQVKVADNGSVEIHVNDASLVEVLRMLS